LSTIFSTIFRCVGGCVSNSRPRLGEEAYFRSALPVVTPLPQEREGGELVETNVDRGTPSPQSALPVATSLPQERDQRTQANPQSEGSTAQGDRPCLQEVMKSLIRGSNSLLDRFLREIYTIMRDMSTFETDCMEMVGQRVAIYRKVSQGVLEPLANFLEGKVTDDDQLQRTFVLELKKLGDKIKELEASGGNETFLEQPWDVYLCQYFLVDSLNNLVERMQQTGVEILCSLADSMQKLINQIRTTSSKTSSSPIVLFIQFFLETKQVLLSLAEKGSEEWKEAFLAFAGKLDKVVDKLKERSNDKLDFIETANERECRGQIIVSLTDLEEELGEYCDRVERPLDQDSDIAILKENFNKTRELIDSAGGAFPNWWEGIKQALQSGTMLGFLSLISKAKLEPEISANMVEEGVSHTITGRKTLGKGGMTRIARGVRLACLNVLWRSVDAQQLQELAVLLGTSSRCAGQTDCFHTVQRLDALIWKSTPVSRECWGKGIEALVEYQTRLEKGTDAGRSAVVLLLARCVNGLWVRLFTNRLVLQGGAQKCGDSHYDIGLLCERVQGDRLEDKIMFFQQFDEWWRQEGNKLTQLPCQKTQMQSVCKKIKEWETDSQAFLSEAKTHLHCIMSIDQDSTWANKLANMYSAIEGLEVVHQTCAEACNQCIKKMEQCLTNAPQNKPLFQIFIDSAKVLPCAIGNLTPSKKVSDMLKEVVLPSTWEVFEDSEVGKIITPLWKELENSINQTLNSDQYQRNYNFTQTVFNELLQKDHQGLQDFKNFLIRREQRNLFQEELEKELVQLVISLFFQDSFPEVVYKR